LQSRFAQSRVTTLVQQIAPRKNTGARNVTRKSTLSNETLNCHSRSIAHAFSVSLKCNREHARGEMDFLVRAPGVTQKKKPGEAGL
jgi:hypothetical protein